MIVGVLLAAGASERMGRSKPLVRRGAEMFAAKAVRTMWRACDCVVVVLGADAAMVQAGIEIEFTELAQKGQLHLEVARAKNTRKTDLEVHFVTNAKWQAGMLSSVQAGLSEALLLKPEAVMVHPVDHPDVSPETVEVLGRMMLDALSAAKAPERKVFSYGVVPRYKGRRGHPVVLSPALATAVRRDREATDLSDAIRRNTRLLGYLDVNDPGITLNLNKPAQLKVARPARRTSKARTKRKAS